MSGPIPIETTEDVMADRRGWYLDRGINPAYIVPLITAILAGLAWAGSTNSHMAVVDTTLVQHAADDKATEKRVDSLERRTDDQLKAINEKLDRLIERRR